MARKPISEKASAKLSAAEVQSAIPKVQKRLAELQSVNINALTNETGGNVLDSLSQKINATLRTIYPVDSLEYQELQIETFQPRFMVFYEGLDTSLRGNLDSVREKVGRGITMLNTLLEILEEQLTDNAPDTESKAIRAYSDLDLHPEIERAATSLYQDGHYANAVEAAVKALNGLVRLRSGL